VTRALLLGSALTLVLAPAAALPRVRSSALGPILLVLAAGWPVVVLLGPAAAAGHGRAPAGPLSDGLGTLELTRVGGGLLALTAACAWLRWLGRRRAQRRGRSLAVAVAVAPVAVLATSARGMVPLALLLALVPLLVAGRWGAVDGAGALRAVVSRAVAIGAIGLLAGAALAPTVGLTHTAPSLVGLCVAVAMAALVGLLPFAPWSVLAAGLAPSEADLGLTWCVPVGLLGVATLLAGEPRAVAASLQALLFGLGLATAVVWSAVAAGGPDRTRVSALQAADVGLMAVGLASGRTDGLLGALLLLLLTLVVPPALASGAPGPARVAGWLAAGGLPPIGAFPGRLLVLAAASTVAFLPTAVVTLAMGGLLIGGARGALGGFAAASGRSPEPGAAREGRGTAAGVGWLAAGAALLAGPLGPVLVPLVYGVRW